MTQISAGAVRDLRDQTGAGMMDCKKALVACQGDVAAAKKHLREKGLAKATQKSSRVAAEGVVAATVGPQAAVVVEVNCETDFVARNEQLQTFANQLCQWLAQHNTAESASAQSAQQLLQEKFDDNNTVEQAVHAVVSRIGENVVFRRFAKLSGGNGYGSYVHHGGDVGVIVQLTLGDASKATDPCLHQLTKDLCMHIAACSPHSVSRDDLAPEIVQTEQEVLTKQLQNQGKKPELIEKVVQGKMNKFFAQACLLQQQFVKNSDLSVQQVVDAAAKQLGCTVTIDRFVHLKMGADSSA
ncbi:MAG: translation elongation factor Ts [Myxococcota bacterium]